MHNLYEQELLDHYQNPRNFGLLTTFDFISPMYNPSCGDSVTISGLIEDGAVKVVKFEGKGCILSVAMASKLTVFAVGKKTEEIKAYDEQLVEQLLNMPLGLKRMQCGMLSLIALQKGISQFLNKKL